jgi:hypothetical protein
MMLNVDKKGTESEGGSTTVSITGLPIDLQVVSRLIKRLSQIGHVLAATRRAGQALITFEHQQQAARALVDESLQQAGMAVHAVNLADALDAPSEGIVRDMVLEHQQKVAAQRSFATVSSRRIELH